MGKGSRQNGSMISGKRIGSEVGPRGLQPDPVGCRWSARAAQAAWARGEPAVSYRRTG